MHPLLSKPRKLPNFQDPKESKPHQSTTCLSVSFILFISQNFIKIFIFLGLGHVLAKVNIHSLSLCPGWLPCLFFCSLLGLLFAAIPSLSSLFTFPHFSPFWTVLFCLLFPPFAAPFHPLFGPSFGLYFQPFRHFICSPLSLICSPLSPLVSSLL